MKNEKISECISLINDKHLEEAACYVKDVYFHKNTEKNQAIVKPKDKVSSKEKSSQAEQKPKL